MDISGDCGPQDRCTDQLGITMPFYASLAYSVGAFLAWKSQINPSRNSAAIGL